MQLARGLGYRSEMTTKCHLLFVHTVTGERVVASGTPGSRSYTKTEALLRKGAGIHHNT